MGMFYPFASVLSYQEQYLKRGQAVKQGCNNPTVLRLSRWLLVVAKLSRPKCLVAQLVEQRTVNPWVAGSSPAEAATFVA